MRFLSPLLILTTLFAAACGGGAAVSVFPEVFSQERADGKIPVKVELIREQTQKEIDGMPEKQATAERWQRIERDYTICRHVSGRRTREASDKAFAECMSNRGYVYMLRLDAEQLHDEIAAAEPVKYAAEKKAEEEARLAAEKRRKEDAAATARKRELDQIAAELKAAQEEKNSNLRIWAEDGNIAKVRAWLDAGANPNAKNKYSETALMYASSGNHIETVKMLLDAGAYPDMTNNDGTTALLYAAQDGHTEIVKMILLAGAKPSKRDKKGNTALQQAAFFGHFESAKALLAAGADANTNDYDRYTALMSSGQEGKYDIVQLLLDCGASMSKKNRYKQSVWELANDDPILYNILAQHQAAMLAGRRVSSCKGRWSLYVEPSGGAVATAPPPNGTSGAEAVFENVWRSIVVVRQGESQGSGVIVRPNVVATNCHVIDGYGDIVVYKHDNRRASTDTLYNATVRKRDESRDFCLLYVAGLRGASVKLREYRTLKVGEDVYAAGSPKGLDLSLSSGIISQLRRDTDARYIQTDAAISPGSSGGGLFDSDSNLIGILTSKLVDEEVEGIGFAIPADLAVNL